MYAIMLQRTDEFTNSGLFLGLVLNPFCTCSVAQRCIWKAPSIRLGFTFLSSAAHCAIWTRIFFRLCSFLCSITSIQFITFYCRPFNGFLDGSHVYVFLRYFKCSCNSTLFRRHSELTSSFVACISRFVLTSVVQVCDRLDAYF